MAETGSGLAADILREAKLRGWTRCDDANAFRCARRLVREGRLEPHPGYEEASRIFRLASGVSGVGE